MCLGTANSGRIGNLFLPACDREIRLIDDEIARVLPELSVEFFADIREHNAIFARSGLSGIGDEENSDDE